VYQFAKRASDMLFSVTGLVVFSPAILLISLLIKMGSPGPVVYKGVRVGKSGKRFEVLKFRTMVDRAEQIGASSTPDDDPRITNIGKVLRRYKLDEIPQFINVLRGEMSFVGPRPQVPWAVEEYSDEERAVLEVQPGIADYAFVVLPSEGEVLRGSSDPDRDYWEKVHPHKMRLSLEYVRQRSIALDLKIIVDTALLSFFRRRWFLKARSEEGNEIIQDSERG